MLSSEQLDCVRFVIDDGRPAMPAGRLLPANLARHLGLGELVRRRVGLGDAPGWVKEGNKMLTPVSWAQSGADRVDDAEALRADGTERVLDGAATVVKWAG